MYNPHSSPLALLTPDEMGTADRLTIEAGTPGYQLMQQAGERIVELIDDAFSYARNIYVVCGPGNNGGDGFVAAQRLKENGKSVSLCLLGDAGNLSGDAALAHADWSGETLSPDLISLEGSDLIIDALFGAGLSRPVKGEASLLIDRMNENPAEIIAVDLPSGIDGRSGQVQGNAVEADASVTFFRKKPGHLLLPGRIHCGQVYVGNIGIEEDVLDKQAINLFENAPRLWEDFFPRPGVTAHKYSRGHAYVISGPELATGASRLTAQAALRAGAGLVSIAGDEPALLVHAAHVTAIMLKTADTPGALAKILEDERITAIALGPALGKDELSRDYLKVAMSSGRPLVLDADALSIIAEHESILKRLSDLPTTAVLTPHEGEFQRLFPDLTDVKSRVERVRAAAVRCGAVLVLKGPDSVIASPDGFAAINANAPPWLATAGSGDTLTGIITGLIAQGMAPFEAACAGVWLHGEAGNVCGPALIADDLQYGLKAVLEHFY